MSTYDGILLPVADLLNKLQPADQPAADTGDFQTAALRIKIPVYYLAMDATERMQRAAMVALTLCGKAPDPTPARWQTWVLTWSCVVFPELVPLLKQSCHQGDYEFKLLSSDFVTAAVNAILDQRAEATAGDKYLVFDNGLPDASNIPLTAELASASGIEGLYAYYAMIVFIMGKSLNPATITSISRNRPLALIRTRQLNSSEFILTGDGKIAPDNYGRVQGGWVRATMPRMVVVRHLARLYAADQRPETLNSIVVNMDMLRNSGQTYIFYVFELLVSCPWCLEIPALRANYRHYTRMVSKITSQPLSIQPFYKLMMQDADKDVRRRNIESLIAVAIYYAGQTRKTMNQYRIHPDSKPVIDAFRDLASSKGIRFTEMQDQAVVEVSTV